MAGATSSALEKQPGSGAEGGNRTSFYDEPSQWRSQLFYGSAVRADTKIPLPFFRDVKSAPSSLPTFPIDPAMMQETCASKIVMGGLIGGVLGIGMGVFMGAMGDVSPLQVAHGREVPQAPLREQMRVGWKGTVSKARGWAKSFGVMTALFGGYECVIEKQRATKDVWNQAYSGCAVGATLAAKEGPAAACMGCAGFAAFSFLIDKVMGGMH
jgi:import inner membrane translocase subunit TIM22